MSEPLSGEVVAEAAPEAAASPLRAGAMLRRLRESQGIHVAALAVALKVSVRQIEALETDRLDLLPDLTFARALTASLCRQLKVDPQPMLDALPQHAPTLGTGREPINERFNPSGAVGATSWREQLARPPVAVAVALLLAAVILLLLPVLRDQLPTAPEATPAAVPPAAAPAGAEPAAPGASGLVIESVTPALPASAAMPEAAAPASTVPAAAPTTR